MSGVATSCDRPGIDLRVYTVHRVGYRYITWVDILCLIVGALVCIATWPSWTLARSLGLGTVTGIFALHKASTITEESMMIMQDLGIQLTTTTLMGTKRHTFIDRGRITDVVINEGITMCRVIYYMGFIVDDKQSIILAYNNVFPRLASLLDIYHGTRALLFGDTEPTPRLIQ